MRPRTLNRTEIFLSPLLLDFLVYHWQNCLHINVSLYLSLHSPSICVGALLQEDYFELSDERHIQRVYFLLELAHLLLHFVHARAILVESLGLYHRFGLFPNFFFVGIFEIHFLGNVCEILRRGRELKVQSV